MIKYYKTDHEFHELHARLKLMACPHCKLNGYLILHSRLYGNADNSDTDLIQRGRRIFCNNRKKRKGCGGTFSILKSTFIKHFSISARALWRYLENLLNGKNKAQAFRSSGCSLGNSSVYRLYRRFQYGQARIRTFLARVKDPPCLSDTGHPVLLTLMHLKTIFKNCLCPISAFQHQFQASFLQ